MEIKALSLTIEQQEVCLAGEVSDFTVIQCNCMDWHYFNIKNQVKWKKSAYESSRKQDNIKAMFL